MWPKCVLLFFSCWLFVSHAQVRDSCTNFIPVYIKTCTLVHICWLLTDEQQQAHSSRRCKLGVDWGAVSVFVLHEGCADSGQLFAQVQARHLRCQRHAQLGWVRWLQRVHRNSCPCFSVSLHIIFVKSLHDKCSLFQLVVFFMQSTIFHRLLWEIKEMRKNGRQRTRGEVPVKTFRNMSFLQWAYSQLWDLSTGVCSSVPSAGHWFCWVCYAQYYSLIWMIRLHWFCF